MKKNKKAFLTCVEAGHTAYYGITFAENLDEAMDIARRLCGTGDPIQSSSSSTILLDRIGPRAPYQSIVTLRRYKKAHLPAAPEDTAQIPEVQDGPGWYAIIAHASKKGHNAYNISIAWGIDKNGVLATVKNNVSHWTTQPYADCRFQRLDPNMSYLPILDRDI